MKRKLLTAVTLTLAGIVAAKPTHKQTLLEYIGPAEVAGEHWMRPMVSPLVEVRVLEGHAPGKDRRTVMCSWSIRDKQYDLVGGDAVVSHVGVFLCEDGTVLEMTNVYFGDAK